MNLEELKTKYPKEWSILYNMSTARNPTSHNRVKPTEVKQGLDFINNIFGLDRFLKEYSGSLDIITNFIVEHFAHCYENSSVIELIEKTFDYWLENVKNKDKLYLDKFDYRGRGFYKKLVTTLIENKKLKKIINHQLFHQYCMMEVLLNRYYESDNYDNIVNSYLDKYIKNEDDVVELLKCFENESYYENKKYEVLVNNIANKKIITEKIFDKFISKFDTLTSRHIDIIEYYMYFFKSKYTLLEDNLNKLINASEYVCNKQPTYIVILNHLNNNLSKEKFLGLIKIERKFHDNFNEYHLNKLYNKKYIENISIDILKRYIDNKSIKLNKELLDFLIDNNSNIIFNEAIKWMIEENQGFVSKELVDDLINDKNTELILHMINCKYILTKDQIDKIFEESLCLNNLFDIIFSQYLEKNKENFLKWIKHHNNLYSYSKDNEHINKFNLDIDNSYIEDFIKLFKYRPNFGNEVLLNLKKYTKIDLKLIDFYESLSKNTTRYTVTEDKLEQILEKNKKKYKFDEICVKMLLIGGYDYLAEKYAEKYKIKIKPEVFIILSRYLDTRIKYMKILGYEI